MTENPNSKMKWREVPLIVVSYYDCIKGGNWWSIVKVEKNELTVTSFTVLERKKRRGKEEQGKGSIRNYRN